MSAAPVAPFKLRGAHLWGAVACIVLSAVAISWWAGLGTGLLMLAGAALLGTLFTFWQSLESLTRDGTLGLEEALTLAAPNEEEERKRAILRALRDLEYERSVGKISGEDYQSLSQHYRTEAKRLLRKIDEDMGPSRRAAEEAVDHELIRAGLSEGQPKNIQSSREPQPQNIQPTEEPRPGPTRACTQCGARCPLGERACGQCSRSLAGPTEQLCTACPAKYESSANACPVCGVEAHSPSKNHGGKP